MSYYMNSRIIQNQIMMHILIVDNDRPAKSFAVICDHIVIAHLWVESNLLSDW